jgi:serine/threonine-protein kinase
VDYTDPVERHAALHFLEQFVLDQEQGVARTLDEYVDRFPDHEDVIRREYADLCEHGTPTPTSKSSWDFGPYELLEEIGRGGMGVVYKARQKELDRVVAIKMILARHLARPRYIERFRAEARAAASLRHPHIVNIHEIGQLHGQYYFAMEYVAGSSLAERIAKGGVEITMAIRWMEQVARAVGHFHGAGIIHRDLKPSNILLDDADQPFVTDFGLAKLFRARSEMTITGEILGTASYMAPEQAFGRSAEAGPASDVYSLGAILYEMLSGRPPFREENPVETILKVRTGEPTPLRRLNRQVPARLEWICMKCLARSAADRYPSANALAEDLERYQTGKPLLVRPPSPGQRLRNWCLREPALAARLGVLAVFFLVEMTINTLTTVGQGIHREILGLLGLWSLTAILFQQMLKIRGWSLPSRYVWGALDSVLLFAVLLVTNGVASPLVIGCPLLIVASGLWYRVRFVGYMTVLCSATYLAHVFDFYHRRIDSDLRGILDDRWDRHLTFLIALVCLGFIVSHIVRRVQLLSGYQGREP